MCLGSGFSVEMATRIKVAGTGTRQGGLSARERTLDLIERRGVRGVLRTSQESKVNHAYINSIPAQHNYQC